MTIVALDIGVEVALGLAKASWFGGWGDGRGQVHATALLRRI